MHQHLGGWAFAGLSCQAMFNTMICPWSMIILCFKSVLPLANFIFHWTLFEKYFYVKPHSKRISIRLTGGIAVYKSIELNSLLTKGVQKCSRFDGRRQSLYVTGNDTTSDLWKSCTQYLIAPERDSGHGTLELAKWADLICHSRPPQLTFMARYTQGHGNDLLKHFIASLTGLPYWLPPQWIKLMWAPPCHPSEFGLC